MERIRDHFPEENIPEGRTGRKPVPTRQILEAPLLRRRRLIRLQNRVDRRNQRPELRLLRLLRALISRRRREPAHLVDRVPAQPEHPRCFPPALTLNKSELPDRGIGFNGVPPRLTLPNQKRSAYPLAGFCSAMQQHPAAAPVADYSTAVYTRISGTIIAPSGRLVRLSICRSICRLQLKKCL